jgi:hypothetical protein
MIPRRLQGREAAAHRRRRGERAGQGRRGVQRGQHERAAGGVTTVNNSGAGGRQAGEEELLRSIRLLQVVRAGDLVDHAAEAGGVGGYVRGGLPPRRPRAPLVIGDAAGGAGRRRGGGEG